jgi:hypothetical protein
MTLTGLEHISNPYVAGLADAFITAAIPEELFKFVVIYFYARRHPEFDEPMDGVVYGVATGLGFATLENILYVSDGGIGVAILRAFTAVPCHAFAGAIMGFYVGQSKFRPQERGKLVVASLLWPILLHGVYDFPLLTLKAMSEHEPAVSPSGAIVGALIGTSLVALIVEAVWALRTAGRLRRQQLSEQRQHDVASGGVGIPLPPKAAPSKLKGWLMVAPGFLLASGGGLVTLGLTLGMLLSQTKRDEVVPLLAALFVIGVIPLGLGTLLFALGIRALNQRFQFDRAMVVQGRVG